MNTAPKPKPNPPTLIFGLDHQTSLFPLVKSDLRAGENAWRECSEDTYHEMLGAVPPQLMVGTAFLVGEPVCSDQEGFTLWYGFFARAGRFFCRLVREKDFLPLVQNLRITLATEEEVAAKHQQTLAT